MRYAYLVYIIKIKYRLFVLYMRTCLFLSYYIYNIEYIHIIFIISNIITFITLDIIMFYYIFRKIIT